MTADQRTAEMAKLRNWQNGMGLTGGGHGSYFSNVGVSDMTAFPMFRQHFRSMRAYYFGEFYQVETYPWGDPMRIRAMGAGSSNGVTVPPSIRPIGRTMSTGPSRKRVWDSWSFTTDCRDRCRTGNRASTS